jgi:hypothetical protein
MQNLKCCIRPRLLPNRLSLRRCGRERVSVNSLYVLTRRAAHFTSVENRRREAGEEPDQFCAQLASRSGVIWCGVANPTTYEPMDEGPESQSTRMRAWESPLPNSASRMREFYADRPFRGVSGLKSNHRSWQGGLRPSLAVLPRRSSAVCRRAACTLG